MPTIDLNCDMGESFAVWELGDDAALMPLISSANVACGYHAGDPAVMARTVDLAARHGLAVGAHVSYPDRAGFGRRFLACSEAEIYADVLYQLGALAAFCRAAGVPLAHVKAHGALYNVAARDQQVARALARAVRDFDPGLLFFTLPGSLAAQEAGALGLKVVGEGFADRAYQADGSLVSRQEPGAVITDPDAVARRAVLLARGQPVPALDGTPVAVPVATLCIHGDTPGAVALARAVREQLAAAGVTVAAPGRT